MKNGSAISISALCLIAGLAIGYRAAIVGKLAEKKTEDEENEEDVISDLEKLDGVE